MAIDIRHFLLATIVFCCIQWAESTMCVYHDPYSTTYEFSNCSHPSSDLQRRRNSTTENRIYIDVSCGSTPCPGASLIFQQAADYLSSIIAFESPIYVNASFISFCDSRNECTTNGIKSIGLAYPSVSYLMQDPTDNMVRMFPQAILKQYTNIPVQPSWAHYDINAQFNSDVQWYFENNLTEITSTQTDFQRTVLHELVHGLGFVSSWNNEMYNRLSPFNADILPFLTPAKLVPAQVSSLSYNLKTSQGVQPFWGFVEFPLDRLFYHGNESLTHFTKKLNTWYDSNVLFNTVVDMANGWSLSEQRKDAEEIYQWATHARSVSITIKGTFMFWLETSLVPFLPGSSFSHVDQTYQTSSNYLMVYNANRGVDLHKQNGSFTECTLSQYLRLVLLELGYTLKSPYSMSLKPYKAQINYWEPSASVVGTPENPSQPISVYINTTTTAHTPTSSANHLISPGHPISSLLLGVWSWLCVCTLFVVL